MIRLDQTEVREAGRLYSEGLTINEVAERLDLSYYQARTRILSSGTELRPPSTEGPKAKRVPEGKAETVVYLRDTGDLTWREIGQMTNLSHSGARRIYLRAKKEGSDARDHDPGQSDRRAG